VTILAFFIVHLYAAVGTEGALEAMVGGKVDANWARQHHDLWYEELDRADGGGEILKDGGGRAGTDACSDHAE